jgi:type II secretory pathway pseudopilin PulG
LAIATTSPDSRTHSAGSSAEPRLSRWEILGAWLHLWTPPKGLEVPPVPWRKIALWSAVAAIVLGAAAAIAVPKIDSSKKEGAAERARQEAAAIAAERARLRADQRIHRLTIAAGAAPVAALEGAITADAKQRAAAKTISGPVLSTKCEQAGTSAPVFPDSVVYKCFVKTATGLRGQGNDVLGTGYPFVATIYTNKRTAAWCKQNPHADEKGSRGDVRVKLSPVCAGNLWHVL